MSSSQQFHQFDQETSTVSKWSVCRVLLLEIGKITLIIVGVIAAFIFGTWGLGYLIGKASPEMDGGEYIVGFMFMIGLLLCATLIKICVESCKKRYKEIEVSMRQTTVVQTV